MQYLERRFTVSRMGLIWNLKNWTVSLSKKGREGRKGGREEGRKGGRKGGREAGRKGGRKEGRQRGREGLLN